MSHCEHSCWAACPRSTITPLPRHPSINATASGYRHRHRRRPPQCEWSWLLPSPPQCECTCLLPSLDLLRQTVAPQPRQPPQCEWSWLLPSPLQCECTCLLPSLDLLRQTAAAAVRVHLPAALARPAQADRARPAQTDRSCRRSAPAQTDRRSATKAATAVRMEHRSANAPARCLCSTCSDRPSLRNQGSRRSAKCEAAAVPLLSHCGSRRRWRWR